MLGLGKKKTVTLQCYMMLLLPIIGFLVFNAYPLLWCFRRSFFRTDCFSTDGRFVGLENFAALFTKDFTYWKSWLNTIIFMVIKIPADFFMFKCRIARLWMCNDCVYDNYFCCFCGDMFCDREKHSKRWTMVSNMKNKFADFAIAAIMLAVIAVTLYPILYTVSSSLKTNIEILGNSAELLPCEPTFKNYLAVCGRDFDIRRMMFNSILYACFNVFVSLAVSSAAGYVFARGEFPGKKLIFACFTAVLIIKTGGMEIYPQLEILKKIGLKIGLHGLMFMRLFGIPTVNIYLIGGYLRTLPMEIDEAAQIDGMSFTGTFFHIILPLLKPILVVAGMLSFSGSWNDYILPAIFTLTTPDRQTLIVGLTELKASNGAAADWDVMLAGTVIMLVPALIIFAACNKFFVSGLLNNTSRKEEQL